MLFQSKSDSFLTPKKRKNMHKEMCMCRGTVIEEIVE